MNAGALTIRAMVREDLPVFFVGRQLYARAGFIQTGQIDDMFRIDGASLGYTFMSSKIR